MITTSEPRRRILPYAVVASVLAHLAGGAIYLHARGALTPPIERERRTAAEIITISSAPRPAERALPQPLRAARANSLPRVHRQRAALPARPELPAEQPHPPKAELRKPPAVTTPPPIVPPAVARAPQVPSRTISSDEQQFAQTIALAKARANPLAVPSSPPAAPTRFPISMEGIHGDLRRGQGYITPRKMWRGRDGYVYYEVTYEYIDAEGHYESGRVPWAVRYVPRDDPFARGVRLIPIQPPPAEYTLPDGERFESTPFLRHFFPDRFPDG